MIKYNDKKVTPRQFALQFWMDHLDGLCAFTDQIDDQTIDDMTKKEMEQVAEYINNVYWMMRRRLSKAKGEV